MKKKCEKAEANFSFGFFEKFEKQNLKAKVVDVS